MSAFIVAYDLRVQGQNYPCITKKLEALKAFHMQQSVWIVSTTMTAVDLRDHLQSCLDANDKLFVGQFSSAAWKTLGKDADAWIKSTVT